jgi:hypothetical protein
MNGADDELSRLRDERNAARADLLTRVNAARTLASPKALGQRLRHDVEHHARGALSQAMEIAGDNRGVLAGTVSALLLWAARRQVLSGAAMLAPRAGPLLGWAKAMVARLTCRKS